MTMRELAYQVSFNTPAFLGNAEQQAQWRTPPFKALLRQWWRVAKAPEVGYDYRELLKLENALFGSAGDDSGGGRSKVQLRLRLSSWDKGNLAKVENGLPITHPEVKATPGANLYLGYGPIGGAVPRSAIDPIFLS
jgi:CRISPR-associated protein Cmr1